jgi:hypothetical protein
MEPLLLPPPDETERLLDGLTRLVATRSPAPLVISLITEPAKQYLTDRWSGTPRGAEILARHLLGYAAMSHLEAFVGARAQLGMCAESARPDRHKGLQHRTVRADGRLKSR